MKVLLSVFSVKVLQQKDEQVLSNFGNNIDFLHFFKDFTDHIFKNIVHWHRLKTPTLSLTTLDLKKIIIKNKERFIYGYLEAGRDGDDFKVKNFKLKKPVDRYVIKEESSLRSAFFYLSIPSAQKRGYLILQVPEGKGIKHLLEYALREYTKSKVLDKYRIEISNLISEQVFHKMINEGLLKELSFTKYGIPDNIDGLNNSNIKPEIGSGSMKTVFQDYNLGARFKDFIKTTITKRKEMKEGDERTVIEFDNIKDADEVTAKIVLNGKQKTFHVENFNRTLPDLDVTNEVLNSKGEIDLDKLIEKAVDLIKENTFTAKKEDVEN